MKKDTIYLRKVIGKRFKHFRQKIGLVQKDLARPLEVPVKTISAIEVENQLPTIPMIVKLMKLYRLSPLWLLSGEGEMFLAGDSPEAQRLEYFKKAFPGVPADPELLHMIERLAVPIMRNSLLVKFYELSETFGSHIEKYEKQKSLER